MPETEITSLPLTWPQGWNRTPANSRELGRYGCKVSFAVARNSVIDELVVFGVLERDIILSTNIPVKRDGFPYANHREPEDSGVAVYWIDPDGTSRVMACDSWRTVRENLRALSTAIKALRTIRNSKAGEVLERAYAGFKALPQTSSDSHWKVVLELQDTPNEEITRKVLRVAFAVAISEAHPDLGGNQDDASRVNAAHVAAKAELGFE